MKFLKRKTSWSNGEMGLVKTAVLSCGLVAGIYFYEYLRDFISLFFLIFIVAGVLSTILYIGKAKR